MADKPKRSRRPKATGTAPSKAPAAPKGEAGLSGTTNWNGRLFVESNSKLQWEKAYGVAGSQEWGQWELLERTDTAVASALNLLAAPIRDADVEIELPELLPDAQVEVPLPPEEGQPDVSDMADPGASAAPETAEAEAGDEAGPSPQPAPTLKPDHPQQAIADFVKDNLTKWLEPKWPTLLEQIVRYGLGYGFSLHEIVWDTRDDDRVPGGKAVYVKKLAQRLPSSVKPDGWVEKDGDLSVIKQTGVRDGKWEATIELPADKCVLATWNRQGNNYQGFSAFRPGWYLGKQRADLLRVLAVGHQRESCGVPVVKFDKDASVSEPVIDALQRTVEGMVYHEAAGIVLPPGADLTWFFSPGANKSSVLETWRAYGIAIMELVQAQQMALGTGDTGSRAVGEVHDASKNSFVQGVVAWIEGVFNGIGSQPYTGLVKKLIDLNFGEQEEYPVFKLRLKEADTNATDKATLMTAVKTAKDAGALHITEDDEDHVREILGLPEIDPVERAAAKAQADQQKADQMDAMREGMGKGPPEKPAPSLAELLGASTLEE